MRCMVCGCSPLNACVTENGPCRWVDTVNPLCSECVGAVCAWPDLPISEPPGTIIDILGSIDEQEALAFVGAAEPNWMLGEPSPLDEAVMAEMRRVILGPRMAGL